MGVTFRTTDGRPVTAVTADEMREVDRISTGSPFVGECLVELPDTVTVDDVSWATGGRRHILVWNLAKHPDFDCRIVTRQPLTAQKRWRALELVGNEAVGDGD